MEVGLKRAFNDLPLLPPHPSLVETISILKQESKTAVALAELKGLTKTLPNPNILINAIVLKEAQASSGIENVITTQDKLYQALYAKSAKPDLATNEVLRYREALLMGTALIKEKGFLNANGIISIQRELEANNAGLRTLPGTALINDITNEVIYTPPDNFDTISRLMKNLEDYINYSSNDISPLIKLAIQHCQFESIHPFYDGNGRTGRIINVLYLMLRDLLNEPILYLSAYIIQNKGEYYRLLQEVRIQNNWENWILFLLKGIEQTSLATIDQINKINQLFTKTQELIQENLPKIYSKDLVEQLYIHPYCKIDFLVQNMKLNRKTAGNYLKSIEQLGVLRAETKGKEVIYVNDELYELFKKGT
jgi:Fic family protein